MLRFIRNKIIHFVILICAVAIISFILLQISPLDPVNTYLKEAAVSESQRQLLESYWGVGQPLYLKIGNWFFHLIQGDFGTSLIYRVPVLTVIFEKFKVSFVLMALSWILSSIIGFLLGVIAGKNKGNAIDKGIKIVSYILQSSPAFWVGMIIIMVFSISLNLFPSSLATPIGVVSSDVTFWQWLSHLILPVLTLSLVYTAPIALYTRNELINVLNSDYVLFAKARGEEGWLLIERQALRNILLPVVTLQFLSFGQIFGGAILVEQVFSYPGLGQTVVNAGLQSDVPLFLAIVLFTAVFVFIGNLIADILYFYINPMIKEGDLS